MSAEEFDAHMLAWGESAGRRVAAGILAPLAWIDGYGRPIAWRTSDKPFPRGYRAGLAIGAGA